jgi:hypothetical protein
LKRTLELLLLDQVFLPNDGTEKLLLDEEKFVQVQRVLLRKKR